jgi:hypothetical protein
MCIPSPERTFPSRVDVATYPLYCAAAACSCGTIGPSSRWKSARSRAKSPTSVLARTCDGMVAPPSVRWRRRCRRCIELAIKFKATRVPAAHRRVAAAVGPDQRQLAKVVTGPVGHHGRWTAVPEGRQLAGLHYVKGVALLALFWGCVVVVWMRLLGQGFTLGDWMMFCNERADE